MPVRALTEERWVYRERLRRRLRGSNPKSVLQIGLFALVGAALSLAVDRPLTELAVAIVLPLGPGMRGPRRLPA